MENEEREVRGMAVVWKRLRALAVFLLVLSMLESDGIEQEIMRISIGYCAEGGSRLSAMGWKKTDLRIELIPLTMYSSRRCR